MTDHLPPALPAKAMQASAHFHPDGAPAVSFMRDPDWRRSALGDPASWPQSLRYPIALMMDTSVPMWLAWGENLGVIYNEAYARILGKKHPDAMGAPLRQVWQEVWPDVEALVAATLSGQGLYREDLPLIINRDGYEEPAWFTFSYSPLRDDQGAIRGLICTVWETTEKVLTQRRLVASEADAARQDVMTREVEERYRLVGLATNDAIWDWRLADGHVIWNQALKTLFGYDLEQSSADWWLDHIHPDDRSRIETNIHAVIDGGGTTWAEEYRFRREDGTYAAIYDRGTVLRDAGGLASRMIGAMLDLSERRAAEAALRESERLFRTLFESIDEGFCVIEFLDGPHGPMSDYVHVMANPAYAANAGIQNVVGQRVRDMVPLEAEGWVQIYRKVLLTGEPIRFERKLERTGRHLELSALRIEPPERRQVAVLFQDISSRHRAERALRNLNDTLERRVEDEVAERIKTEEALRQSQKMEAVGQLTGGIAHDFNNMLAVVMSSLELLGRRYAAQDEKAKHYVEAAKVGVKRAAQLTQRLLAFSRQQPLKPEFLVPNKLVAGMSEMLMHSLGGAVRLETILAGGLWHTHVDPNQLENALLNLAVNGRDAMPNGGRLTIETDNCHLDEYYAAQNAGVMPGEYVVITVSDTGAGMPPEVIARAFDPFFTTKEVGRGTGLGLSQVYGFVRQSGGHVKIYSQVGQGTAVKIYLPRHTDISNNEGMAPLPVTVICGGAEEMVLVVEDEDAVRQLSVDMLNELGYRVLHADSAAAALSILDSNPEIALIVTDVVMPELNGFKLAEEALRRRPGIKILFTTGYTRNAIEQNGVLAPDVQLLGKPFTMEELARRMHEVLGTACYEKSIA